MSLNIKIMNIAGNHKKFKTALKKFLHISFSWRVT